MRAHELDVVGRQHGFVERRPHRELEPATVRIRRADVRAVAGARVAEQSSEPRAAPGIVAGHQHERGRFSQQEAAAPTIEGTHPLARERAQRVEPAHHEPAKAVVAAGDDDIDHVRAQELGAGAEGRRAGRARRAHRENGTARAEPAREPVGGAVVERTGGVTEPPCPRHGPLELLDSAQRGAYDDGDALGSGRDGRAGQQVLSRGQQELCGAASRAAGLRRRLELLDFAAAPNPQVVHREALDHGNAVAPGDEPRPERVEVGAERGHGPGGDDRDGLSRPARCSRGHHSSRE